MCLVFFSLVGWQARGPLVSQKKGAGWLSEEGQASEEFISFRVTVWPGLLFPGGHLPLLSVSLPASCYPQVEVHARLCMCRGGTEQRRELNCPSRPQLEKGEQLNKGPSISRKQANWAVGRGQFVLYVASAHSVLILAF